MAHGEIMWWHFFSHHRVIYQKACGYARGVTTLTCAVKVERARLTILSPCEAYAFVHLAVRASRASRDTFGRVYRYVALRCANVQQRGTMQPRRVLARRDRSGVTDCGRAVSATSRDALRVPRAPHDCGLGGSAAYSIWGQNGERRCPRFTRL